MPNDTTIWRDLPHGSDLQPGDRCVDITKEYTTNFFAAQTLMGEPLEKHRWQRPVPSHPTPQPGLGQPHTEQLEHDNAELRHALTESQGCLKFIYGNGIGPAHETIREAIDLNTRLLDQPNDPILTAVNDLFPTIAQELSLYQVNKVKAYAAQVAKQAIQNFNP